VDVDRRAIVPLVVVGWKKLARVAGAVWKLLKGRALAVIAWLRSLAVIFSITFAVGTVARVADIPSSKAWTRDHPLPWIWISAGLITGTRYVIVDRDRKKRKRKRRTGRCLQRSRCAHR
jgi:Ni/Fe-hydrogenase subunit HybB-like protein